VAVTGLRSPVEAAATLALDVVSEVGRFSRFVGLLLSQVPPGLRYWHLFMDQCRHIGIGSLPLVILTSVFVGAVAAVQAAYQFGDTVPLLWLGSVVARSVVIEVGPVLTALVVGGRVGSSIAAELGTMRVTEQIDALETLALSPVRYLAVPRLLAATLMVPVVTIFANLLAILGGLIVAVGRVGMTPHLYFKGMRLFFEVHDIYGGLIKSVVFGMIIAVMGCYYGFKTEGGAEGVGISTTQAVVASCVMVLVSDYFLAEILFRVLFK
jgi:phospholipid/cholesterol/gamma-HCH transport system permease protein